MNESSCYKITLEEQDDIVKKAQKITKLLIKKPHDNTRILIITNKNNYKNAQNCVTYIQLFLQQQYQDYQHITLNVKIYDAPEISQDCRIHEINMQDKRNNYKLPLNSQNQDIMLQMIKDTQHESI